MRRSACLSSLLDRCRGKVSIAVKTLVIVARDSMLTELEELLHKNGVKAYTIVSNATGKGVTGKVYGTFLHLGLDTTIVAVLPPDEADRSINALKMLHRRRNEAAQGRPIPLKVFSFPSDE